MNWFKKLSSKSVENHRKLQKYKRAKQNNANDMGKSLSALEHKRIEVLDPEEFFHDPEHVRQYREEGELLNIMSEWEIIQRPAWFEFGNYFSADFAEDLLQLKTNEALAAAANKSQTNYLHHECNKNDNAGFPEITIADLQKHQQQQKQFFQQTPLSLECKRGFFQLLFGDNIKMGIFLPPDNQNEHVQREQHRTSRKRKHDSKIPRSTSSNINANLESICEIHISNDCVADCTKMKTEALANSIMGAIAKDRCISNFNGCDHYHIKHFFHLDDYGSICLNINHILEYKGFGVAIAQNNHVYRHYLKECHSIDENYGIPHDIWELLKYVIQLLWKLLFGHPRNKINPYNGGSGGDTIRTYTLQLAKDESSTFSRNIENFISCTKDSREAAPQVVMRNMRQFMNGMKNYLVKHGEGKFHQEVETARSRLKSDEFLNLDAILETVMHQLVVLPLREHLYGMFVDYYTCSEDIQLLAQNVKYACGRCAVDFGIRPLVTPPSTTSLQVISNLLLRLQEAELPLDKLDIFICVISTIFDATGCQRGQQLGADDFLPVLVYVVAKCGFVGAEIEAEFMWGLLQPTLLNGEPGYYLTALCSAVHVLKSFMASESENGTGSLDWRSSSLPACSSVLRVIIPDECNGSLQTRTLPVRPHTTTREVCRIIAHKARITNPQDYALFKLVDGEETLLNDIECPQDIRLAAKGKHCMLAYKRIDAKIAWPTTAQPAYN